MADADAVLELGPAEELQMQPDKESKMLIRPWMIMLIALIAIGGLAAVSAWVLQNKPTEGERASIIEVWKTVGIAAFFYFLGSSAGSRNKDQST